MGLMMFPPKFDGLSKNKENLDLMNNKSEERKRIQKMEKQTIDLTMPFVVAIPIFFIGMFVANSMNLCNDGFELFLFGIQCVLGWILFVVVLAILIKVFAQLSIRKTIKTYAAKRQQIVLNGEKEREEYKKAFDDEAKTRSVKFANSELAQEIIEWMSEGFYKTIENADRRAHIEQIKVNFPFTVTSTKITCQLGIYDFKLHGCELLTHPIDQAGLARAIASAIQLNVMMKYPNDISNTPISIKINYIYQQEYLNANVTYVANNGNYTPAKSW